MSKPKIIIAIDGHASTGKSTVARELANALGYIYIDSGAMYRAVTLYLIQNEIAFDDDEGVLNALDNIKIHFENDPEQGKNLTFLNGQDVSFEIRDKLVSEHVSPVSAIVQIRERMVEQQRSMGVGKGIVMDGRDIGTVVFPQAELKIFMTAELDVRARRRLQELQAKGSTMSFEEVRDNLTFRDHKDSTRAVSPLKMADDAVVINNSYYTKHQQLELLLSLVDERVKELIS